jgi:tetratricopeptide (TPR) repeat protein
MRRLSFVGIVCLALTAAGCWMGSMQQAAIDHYVASQAMMNKGDYDAALAELKAATRADSSLSVAHAAAGDIYRKRGDWEMAKRSYQSACVANPYAFKPHYNLGVVFQQLAEADRKIESIRANLTQAVQAYIRAITIRGNDFDSNLNLSVCYYQLEKYDLAEQYCKAALELDPKSAPAYSNLGIIYDCQGRPYDAIGAYKSSLELDTHQPLILLNLGSTYMRQGRLKQAVHTFELASGELPNDPAPFEQIGTCYFHMNQEPQALEAYQKAAAISPKSPGAHRGMGVIYMTQFLRDQSQASLRDKALEEWNTSLDAQSNQPDLIKLVEKYRPKPATLPTMQ